MTTIEPGVVERLVERLTAKRQVYPPQGGGTVSSDGEVSTYITDDGVRLVNPDGPEAAALLAQLQARIGEMEVATKAAEQAILDLPWAPITMRAARKIDRKDALEVVSKLRALATKEPT